MPNDQYDGISRRGALQFTATAAVLPLAGTALAQSPQGNAYRGLRDQPFEANWRFYRGDAAGASAPIFDDAGWRKLDLPHDWSIEDLDPQGPEVNAVIRGVDTAPIWAQIKDAPKSIGPFEEIPTTTLLQASRSVGQHRTGHTVGGVGWYRKHFRVPGAGPDKRVELMFDGVYGTTDVWLNGKHLGSHVYGYTAFGLDLTPYLNPEGGNVLALRVANLGVNSRWYSGSGIYRAVRLNITGVTRFARWGVRVATPQITTEVATVALTARIEDVEPGATLSVVVRDSKDRIVARAQAPAINETKLTLPIPHPRLWSPDTPVLYQAECTLATGADTHDQTTVRFGIRNIAVSAETGLLLNGKPTKLRGGCVHHDNGLLGAVALDRAEERKIELLKARGFNAIRTSHNPPSTAFLDACDRLGMLVIEEAFDSWNIPKVSEDYHLYFNEHWRSDLASMIERDANHPSVIIWSIGNEIPEKYTPRGVESARQLVAEVRRLDPTRPITEGINGGAGAPVTRPDGSTDQVVTQFLDIAGYNYDYKAYEKQHPLYPNRVFFGSESFPKDVDKIWRTIDDKPYVIGDFVWTAMDYIGEAGIGMSALAPTNPFLSHYPWINAFCGDVDLIGQQKPQSLMRDVVWGLSPIEMSVERPLPEGKKEWDSEWGWGDELQSWTWPEHVGKPISVRVFTRADRVVLTLNDRQVAEKALSDADRSQTAFSVPFAPGRLVASAYKRGKLIGRRTLETAGPPAALRLHIDRPHITTSRNDLAFVTVSVVDAQGRAVPDDVRVLQAALSGPIELAAFGNANPRGVASYQQPMAKTWHGRALAIVRPTGRSAPAVIEVRSAGLRSAIGKIAVS